ncbi:MAG: hypothetical protein ACT4R6_03235 [Gemmatimonadaceae bacterium]
MSLGAALWGVLWLMRDYWVEGRDLTDFDQIWHAARAVLDGSSPYAVIGPGRPFPLEFDFYYPLPAALIALPLGMLSLLAARIVFVAVSCGLFAWVFLGAGWFRWPALLSVSFMVSAAAAQWTPLLIAATLWPPLAWIWVAKPNVALAMSPLGSPRQRSIAVAGGALVLLISLGVDPLWIPAWLAALRRSTHFEPLVLHLTAGGPLLVLALLRWRRPEARLLFAFAVIPHTVTLYETLALYLIARTRQETLLLALCTAVAYIWQGAIDARSAAYLAQLADIVLVTTYLPALALVLRRPNEGPAPAAVERLAGHWPAWLRGTSGQPMLRKREPAAT